MRLFIFCIGFLIMCSFDWGKKSANATDKVVPVRGALSKESQLLLGNRLFSEKT